MGLLDKVIKSMNKSEYGSTTQANELGITPAEDAAISALSGGVDQETVDKVGPGNVKMIASVDPSEFDESTLEEDLNDFSSPPISKGLPEKLSSRKSYAASVASNDKTDPNKGYSTMFDDLASEGTSYGLEAIRQEVNKYYSASLEEKVNTLASQGDVDGVEATLKAAPRVLNSEQAVTMRAVEKASEELTGAPTSTEAEETHADKMLDALGGWTRSRDVISKMILTQMGRSTDDPVQIWGDVGDMMVFGEQIGGLSKVGKDYFGEYYFVLGGDMFRDIAADIRNQPTHELRVKSAEKVINSIVKNSGVVGYLKGEAGNDKKSNDFVKIFALETLQTFLDAPGGVDDTTRWLYNIFGTLELVSILPASVMSKTVQRIQKFLRSKPAMNKYPVLQGEIIEANPKLDHLFSSRRGETVDGEFRNIDDIPEDDLYRVYPGIQFSEDSYLDGAPNSLVDHIKGVASKAQEAIDVADNTFMYAPREYKNKILKIWSALENNRITAIARPNSNTIVKRDLNKNRVTVKAVYGDETDIPLTLTRALDIRNALIESFQEIGIESNPTLMVKDKSTGFIVDYDPAVHSASDMFYVSTNIDVPMTHADILPRVWGDPEGTRNLNVPTKWLVPPSSWLDVDLFKAYQIANDKKSLVKAETFAIIKDLTTLPMKKKRLVRGLLEAGADYTDDLGNNVGKTFSYRELVNDNYNDDTIMAYYASRVLNDAEWHATNQMARNEMLEQGYRSLSIQRSSDTSVISPGNRLEGTSRSIGNAGRSNEVFENAIIPVTDPERLYGRGIRVAFNPRTGGEVGLDETSLASLRNSGYGVGRLHSVIDTGSSRYNYVVYRESDTGPLPPHVIPYKEGYLPRINKDPYYIDQWGKIREDGEVVYKKLRTVHVARNSHEGKRTIASLQREDPDTEYALRIDRNIQRGGTGLSEDRGLLNGSGSGLWYSKKGPRLTRYRDGSVSAIEDPITAMDRSTSSLANAVSHGKLMDKSIAEHQMKYSDVQINGKSVWYYSPEMKQLVFNKELIRMTPEGLTNYKAQSALQEYEWLEHMAYMPTTVDKLWRNALISIDMALGSTWGWMSQGSKLLLLDLLGATTPGQTLRRVAFNFSIPLKVTRHLVLQSATFLHLYGLAPAETLKATGNAGLILTSLAAYQNPVLWKQTLNLAKANGHTEEEWKELFKQFRKSGKPYSVDSHVAVGEMNLSFSREITENAFQDAANILSNIAKSPFVWGKRLGFDVGELVNQAGSWFVALDKWKKANPGRVWNANQKSLDEINAMARSFSVDMTKVDAFGYQYGAFSAATQFLAIHHKMMAKMLPVRLFGDRTINTVAGEHIKLSKTASIPTEPSKDGRLLKYKNSGADVFNDKARLMLGSLAMFGVTGAGAYHLYDSWKKNMGVDIPPVVDKVLRGGMVDLFMNMALDFMADPVKVIKDVATLKYEGEADVLMSGAISPGANAWTWQMDFVDSVLEGNFIEAFEGPSGAQLTNIFEAGSMFKRAWGFDNFTNTEKLILSMQVAAEEFGFLSDLGKANLAMTYYKVHGDLRTVGKSGITVSPANTVQEIWWKAFIGGNLSSEEELYNHWLKLHKEINDTGNKIDGIIDKDARQMAKWMYKIWRRVDGDYDKFTEITSAITMSFHESNGGNPTYGLRVREVAMQYFRQDPNYPKFVQKVMQDYMLANPEANINHLKNYIDKSDQIKSLEDKETIKQHIDLTREIMISDEEYKNQEYNY